MTDRSVDGMPRTVRHRPKVRSDILDIATYISGNNPSAAERFVVHLQETEALLLATPGIGTL